ncbi:thioredoxin-like domain-containing protein [Xylariaceae sp. FL0016]|nr:thioredoxin-like domain-containing protein [Xylariaceae sp. FL0016]
MHWSHAPFFGLAVLASAVGAWDHRSADEVASQIRDTKAVVVACDAVSRSLEPEWNKAVVESPLASLISVDCNADPGFCGARGVSTGTAVKMYILGNEVATYKGPRRGSAILAWLNRMERPQVTEVKPETLEDFKKADETVFLAYIAADDQSSRAAFEQAAIKFRQEFTFGIVTDSALLQAENQKTPVIKCFKPLDGDAVESSDLSHVEAIEKFIIDSSRPVIGELLPHNHQRFLDRAWPMVYVFSPEERERAEIRQSLNKMARDYYKSLTMVTVDPLEFPDLPSKLGLEPGVYPAGAVHQLSKDLIYPYPKDRGMTSKDLQSWGLEVWQGRVKPLASPNNKVKIDGLESLGNLGGRIKSNRNVKLNIPGGANIKIGGRDEL